MANTNWSNGFKVAGATATQGPFELLGGEYGVTVHTDTWNGASVTLQILGPNGTTYVTCVTAFTADGYATVFLPPGQVQMLVSVAVPTNVNLTCIPISNRR